MERKRKLPARAAARAEQLAKRRNPSARHRTKTPTPPPRPPPEPIVEEPPPTPPPPPLPTSVEHGKPLPTIEVAQSHNLSPEDYQSISESGVLAESLARSRQRWISEGLFEKYWTKPHKKKGLLIEDPKNPPKDSMTKIGNVTITIEPHIVEATMYAVKGPKQKPAPQVLQKPPQQQAARPIIQYGPANGAMPPPAQPKSVPSPVNKPVLTHAPSPHPPTPQSGTQPTGQQAAASPAPKSSTPSTGGAQRFPTPQGVASNPTTGAPSVPPHNSAPPATSQPRATQTASPGPAQQVAPPQPSATPGASPAPAAAKPATADPVIALLAQKASTDSELRDLMKRVAVGQAKPGELAHFQKIIDQLNAEYKSKGGQQGPSADRLLVDGRTVKYFADEVRTILDIVLASNPNQKSSELRPPPGSDALVVLLVKTALEDVRTRDMIRRIAEGRPGNTDATDLKDILDRLNRDAKTVPQGLQAPPQGRQLTPNGVANNGTRLQQPHLNNSMNPPQPMRAKAPTTPSRPDISAVVFDFGAGDRFLFPKFSILEFLPTTSGQQVVASFLIVRKGSTSEYGGDPQLDYYQPVTIRLQTSTGRYLENLARVVAPQDEVRRYMDDVMDNMTRAEYVLLAMQLPRHGHNLDTGLETTEGRNHSPISNTDQDKAEIIKPGVLWTVSAGSNRSSMTPSRQIPRIDAEEESQQKYQRLIRSIEEKEYEYV
ncbi:hypothetical protein A9K55_007377 [Cordyceps militaris]|uniref:SWR1-complex protein 3 domain-containing protein n=1 Tax=Cordyceps militaris TaxID=73501 RepID=A0A2H4SE25_CORMI|nr:hypothetical protein A9K55_007377 [Cordyceps militaris]